MIFLHLFHANGNNPPAMTVSSITTTLLGSLHMNPVIGPILCMHTATEGEKIRRGLVPT